MDISARVVVLGNTGSGKTTLARALAERCSLVHLDLDTVVWDPQVVARPRADEDVATDLDDFVDTTQRWVAEGSYADLATRLAAHATAFVFLNPGVDRCLAHQRSRPWEPHKYADPAEQQRRLTFLEAWTRQYPVRDDRFGLAAHRAAFEAFGGARVEVQDGADAVAFVVAPSM